MDEGGTLLAARGTWRRSARPTSSTKIRRRRSKRPWRRRRQRRARRLNSAALEVICLDYLARADVDKSGWHALGPDGSGQDVALMS